MKPIATSASKAAHWNLTATRSRDTSRTAGVKCWDAADSRERSQWKRIDQHSRRAAIRAELSQVRMPPTVKTQAIARPKGKPSLTHAPITRTPSTVINAIPVTTRSGRLLGLVHQRVRYQRVYA